MGAIADDFSTRDVALIDKVSSVVDGVINHRAMDHLPLNGRNFLELALLIPGNSPAPNFDPTKTNTVLISSAGQWGRGGNVTIDGADNNDDVVGGSLENISQDAVQEFQIATNRFSAQLGRSGSLVINIVPKSGTNLLHGSGSFFYRDRNLQALPATFDRNNPEPPFDREQYSATLGGPLVKDLKLEPAVEVFNVFNSTNVLGVSNVNYSGFANVLVRDSNDPNSPGFLKSSSFGQAVTTAGGVFGSGGPRAFQLAVRFSF